jgi:UDP-N-acetylglucosamine transferase subunit ALG13
VAPLDWGLGHATRCIAIIHMLLENNCEVFIAGSGNSLALLKREFSENNFFLLPAYDPKYPSSGSMAWKMFRQIPHFVRTIKSEHLALERIVSENKIDIVIADNRYGCWSSKAKSVFITHQSNILMPQRFGWLSAIVRQLNMALIKNFDVCWIPDDPQGSLAGELISFGTPPKNISTDFVGHLSRFTPSGELSIIYDVVVILSGPEPQRTLLENIMIPQLKKSTYKYFIVRGLPESVSNTENNNMVDFLDSSSLQRLVESSRMVIARSGYSTIMDMASLGKKAIFIPTPGQTEQLYLAKKLKESGIAFSMEQKNFNLKLAMHESEKYTGFPKRKFSNQLLRIALLKLLNIEKQTATHD